MADLNLSLFRRFLWRAEEIALEPGMKTSVLSVYNDILKPKAEPYLVLDAAVVDAESQWKENREAIEALDALSEPYRRRGRSCWPTTRTSCFPNCSRSCRRTSRRPTRSRS